MTMIIQYKVYDQPKRGQDFFVLVGDINILSTEYSRRFEIAKEIHGDKCRGHAPVLEPEGDGGRQIWGRIMAKLEQQK